MITPPTEKKKKMANFNAENSLLQFSVWWGRAVVDWSSGDKREEGGVIQNWYIFEWWLFYDEEEETIPTHRMFRIFTIFMHLSYVISFPSIFLFMFLFFLNFSQTNAPHFCTHYAPKPCNNMHVRQCLLLLRSSWFSSWRYSIEKKILFLRPYYHFGMWN